MRRADISLLMAFTAVAEHLSFRAAAARLGLTPSAVSHAMRQLEDHLGVRLLHRTSRSVALTDAGYRLYARLRPAFDDIDSSLEDLHKERNRPVGRLRIYAAHMSVQTVIAPIWQRFLATYPEVQLEVVAGAAPIDIVAQGFDAGIGPRYAVSADMIAVQATPPFKVAVVASPAYFARSRSRPPVVPEDLLRHACIRYRRGGGDDEIYDWRFERAGKAFELPVNGQLTVNTPDLTVRAAVDGLGVAYTAEALAEPFIRMGQLVRLLEDWSPSFDGLFLYFGHRKAPATLRALIDMIRSTNRPTDDDPVDSAEPEPTSLGQTSKLRIGVA